MSTVNQKFFATITAPANIGIYTITSIATIPQDNWIGVNRSINYSITLTVQSDCVNETVTADVKMVEIDNGDIENRIWTHFVRARPS
jgi:hypothetical protein